MFQLNDKEFKNWKSQIVTSNSLNMGLRKNPFTFTEHGILMLSSVLNSRRAIFVNIQIMRIFARLKDFLTTRKNLRKKILEMEKRYDSQFKAVFDAIKELLAPPEKPSNPIGFHVKY